jgi:sirohydrochlorin cobaltochelatase
METAALILFGHGARDPEWAGPLHRVRDAILAAAPERRVELAFLEFMAPTLPQCVDALVADGVRAIAIIPMFIAQGGHVKREVPEMIAALRQRHPGLEIRLAAAVGEADNVLQEMARYALRQG